MKKFLLMTNLSLVIQSQRALKKLSPQKGQQVAKEKGLPREQKIMRIIFYKRPLIVWNKVQMRRRLDHQQEMLMIYLVNMWQMN
jgi:catabolite regulation protein CreA